MSTRPIGIGLTMLAGAFLVSKGYEAVGFLVMWLAWIENWEAKP